MNAQNIDTTNTRNKPIDNTDAMNGYDGIIDIIM